jgi:hypothetical protein
MIRSSSVAQQLNHKPTPTSGFIKQLACRCNIIMKLESALMGIFAICILLVFNAPVLGNEDRGEALRALNQYKESQKWFDTFSIKMVTTSRELSPEHESEPSRRVEVTINKLGSLLRLSTVTHKLSRIVGPNPLEVHVVVNKKMGMWLAHGIHEQPPNASGTANTSKALDKYLTDLSCGPILEGYMILIDGKCLVDLVL